MSTNPWGKFDRVQIGCSREPPPSSADKICKNFHDKIQDIRRKYKDSFNDIKKLDMADRMFIEQFRTKNGSVKEPTESMMLPTDSLAELDNVLKKNMNTTYCFKVTPGKTGWCATCKVDHLF